MDFPKKIALVGNPNSGKTSLFNRLTGLNQKVGNFPGVTVDKKSGKVLLPNGEEIELIDLPGSYSLSSTSLDEKIVQDVLLNEKHPDYPDAALIILDASNLKRNLFLATQILDLGIPSIICLNMCDVAKSRSIQINTKLLEEKFGCAVLAISAKKGEGIGPLKFELTNPINKPKQLTQINLYAGNSLELLSSIEGENKSYKHLKILNNFDKLDWINNKDVYQAIREEANHNGHKAELLEINERYAIIQELMEGAISQPEENFRLSKFNYLSTHKVWGTLLFLFVFFLLFQSVFTLAAYPSDWVENGMGFLTEQIASNINNLWLRSLLCDGILAGISGILVFVPQIMILFGLISILEDTGYLSRVSFISDKFLRKFGMNGKSVIPLVGGFACAVPAIMAARNIENKRERLITIFITPLMSCSARLPVYTCLVGMVIPENFYFGFISLKGIAMMGLYLIGILFSLIIALIINFFLRNKEKSTFLLELPDFKFPSFRNVIASMLNKGKTFSLEAGKIILVASIVLWFLSTYGPHEARQMVENKFKELPPTSENLSAKSAELLEFSYIGLIGKTIEPVIKPLGFDWKIGIALLSSFAAREVFVSTMTTIYAIEDSENSNSLSSLKFSRATALSLLIFYVFALQCMSTVAIVKSETQSWTIASIQFFLFTAIAYLSSLLVYQSLA